MVVVCQGGKVAVYSYGLPPKEIRLNDNHATQDGRVPTKDTVEPQPNKLLSLIAEWLDSDYTVECAWLSGDREARVRP